MNEHPRWHTLVNRRPVPTDMVEALMWREQHRDDMRVGGTQVGDMWVSTVFLLLDHAFVDGAPLLFETMIFGGKLDHECDRCSTWEQAETMHERACERARLVAGVASERSTYREGVTALIDRWQNAARDTLRARATKQGGAS